MERRTGRRRSKRPQRYSPTSSPERPENSQTPNKKHCPEKKQDRIQQKQDTATPSVKTKKKHVKMHSHSSKKILTHSSPDVKIMTRNNKKTSTVIHNVTQENSDATEMGNKEKKVSNLSIEAEDEIENNAREQKLKKEESYVTESLIDDEVFVEVTAVLSKELLEGDTESKAVMVKSLASQTKCKLSDAGEQYQLKGSLSCILQAYNQIIKLRSTVQPKDNVNELNCQKTMIKTPIRSENEGNLNSNTDTVEPDIYTEIDNFISGLTKVMESQGQTVQAENVVGASNIETTESQDPQAGSHELEGKDNTEESEESGSRRSLRVLPRSINVQETEEPEDKSDLYVPLPEEESPTNNHRVNKTKDRRKPSLTGKKRGRKTVHKFECVDYDKGLFRCYKCMYESTIHGVRKHVQRHHGGQVECDICGRSFGTRFDLRRHEKMHYNKDGTLNKEAGAWQLAKKERQAIQDEASVVLDSLNTGEENDSPSIKHESSVVTPDGMTQESSTASGTASSCKHCDLIFSKQEDLLKHERDHYNENGELKPLSKVHQRACTAVCSICGYTSKEGLLEQHIERNHGDQKEIQCTICDKMFFTFGDMRRHHTISHQHREKKQGFRSIKKGNSKYLPASYRPVYECSSCNFKTGLKVTLKLHQKTHTKSLKECLLCDFSTIENHLFNKHMKRVHGTPEELCDHCDKKFLTQGDLKRHIRQLHLGEERQACEYCGRVFARKVGLKAHINRVHLKVKSSTCPLCGKGFYDKAHMLDHMESHKPPNEQNRAYTCTYCGRGFRKAMQVKQHENTHTGSRPFQCKYCDKRYAWMSERNKHENTAHTDTRPFSCGECSRSFKWNYQLQSHMVMHTKESKHSCEYCGKVYTLATTLKRHRCKMAPPGAYDKKPEIENMVVLVDDSGNVIGPSSVKEEGNLTVFMCGVCNEVFTDKEGINKHMYEHVDSNVTVLIQDENGVIENEIQLENVEPSQISEIEAAASALTNLSNVIEGTNMDVKPDHNSLNIGYKSHEYSNEKQEAVVEVSNAAQQMIINQAQNTDNPNLQVISGTEYQTTVQQISESQNWNAGEQVQVYNIEQNGEAVVIAHVAEEGQEIVMEQPMVTEHGELVPQVEEQGQVVISQEPMQMEPVLVVQGGQTTN